MYQLSCVVLATVMVMAPVNAFVGVQAPALMTKHAMPHFGSRALRRSDRSHAVFKMQEQTDEQAPPVEETAPLSPGNVPWFERTTTLDRSLRVGGDPLAPKKNPAQRELTGQRAKMEEDGYNWYKSQQDRRSLFGRTLNPLTGALEDKDESVKALNVFEDPIFYIILIVVAPVFVMVAAAYACVVPALSLAFGAQCEF